MKSGKLDTARVENPQTRRAVEAQRRDGESLKKAIADLERRVADLEAKQGQ